MRVTFVSDVHGNLDALARVAERAELLVILGDLLDYVDYHDPAEGILGSIFGADKVRVFAKLRSAGEFAALAAYNRELWATLADPWAVLNEEIERRYRRVLQVVGPDTLLTLGNVDVAQAWNEIAGDVLPYRDAETVTAGGISFGFVAGGSMRPGRVASRQNEAVWRPLVRPAEEYLAAVAAIGPVDVLCSHVPPRLELMRYDTVAARLEGYGPGLLEAIDEYRPAWALSGHVHQPLQQRVRRGRTECVNVGHFQRTERPFELSL